MKSNFNPTLLHNKKYIDSILRALVNSPMSYLELSRATRIDYEQLRFPVSYLAFTKKVTVRPSDENLPYPSRNNKAVISLAIRDL